MTNHHLGSYAMTGNNLLFSLLCFNCPYFAFFIYVSLNIMFCYNTKKSWTNPIVWDQATIVDGVDLIDTNRNTNNDLIVIKN